MRSGFRSLWVIVVAVVGVVALGWASPLTAVVQLLATTAFIMGGTQHPLSTPFGGFGEDQAFVNWYVDGALDYYVAPTGSLRNDSTSPSDYNKVAVYTPEQFVPVYGTMTFDQSVAAGGANLDSCVMGKPCAGQTFPGGPGTTSKYVVFGYSQSARVATIEKRDLIARFRNADGTWDPIVDSNGNPFTTSFVVIGNPNRPNGGVLERFNGLYIPILQVTFDGATPTDSCDADGTDCRFPTADIAWQYDGWTDFPEYPLNLLADINALAGIAYLHPNYTVSVTDALYQGTTGDTTYYMIPAKHLPILMPLEQLGVPSPIITALDAPLRVMVEWGFDRNANPGVPTPARFLHLANPLTDIRNLVVAIPTGWDDGFQEAGLGRPFGTTAPGLFGVGGPTLPADPPLAASAPAAGVPAVSGPGADNTRAQAGGNNSGTTAQVATSERPSRSAALASTRSRPPAGTVRGSIGAQSPQPTAIRPPGDRPSTRVLDTLADHRPKNTPTAGRTGQRNDATGTDADAAA